MTPSRRLSRIGPEWRFRELLAAFGSDSDVQSLIRSEGFDVPCKTVAGWRLRNSVPGGWVPLLIGFALDQGILDSVAQLRKEGVNAP